MDNNAQYWQARTPLHVHVLGLLFALSLSALLGVLWLHWGLAFGLYALLFFGIGVLTYRLRLFESRAVAHDALCFDSINEFSVLDALDEPIPVHILRAWHSPFAITLQLQLTTSHEKKQLIFWRSTLSISSWRALHIYVLRYQLQYQSADLKGAQ